MLNFIQNKINYFLPTSFDEIIWNEYIQIHPIMSSNTGLTSNLCLTSKEKIDIISILSKCPNNQLIQVENSVIEKLYSYLSFLYQDIPVKPIKNELITIDNQWFYVKTDLLRDRTLSAEELYYLNNYTNDDFINNLPIIFSILVRKIEKKEKKGIKKWFFKQKFDFSIEPFSMEYSLKNQEFFKKLSVSTIYSVFFYLISTEMHYLLISLQYFREKTEQQKNLHQLMLNNKTTSLSTSYIPYAMMILKNILNLRTNQWWNYLNF